MFAMFHCTWIEPCLAGIACTHSSLSYCIRLPHFMCCSVCRTMFDSAYTYDDKNLKLTSLGPIRSKIGGKGPKWGLFGVLSFMTIPLVSPSFDQKEQNCFGQPQFYSSIAPMLNNNNFTKNDCMMIALAWNRLYYIRTN